MKFVYPRSTKELQELVSKVTVRSSSNWNVEMLVFEGGKPENPERNRQSRNENQQQTQPTYDVRESNPGHIGGRRGLLITQPSLL